MSGLDGARRCRPMRPPKTKPLPPRPHAGPEKNIKTLVQDSPISKALSTILEFAAKHNASDVHIEPLQDRLKIRCRIDGVLREIMKLPKSTEPPLVSAVSKFYPT